VWIAIDCSVPEWVVVGLGIHWQVQGGYFLNIINARQVMSIRTHYMLYVRKLYLDNKDHTQDLDQDSIHRLGKNTTDLSRA
jgi:hypothetical protein